jgi:hypothetical protein
MDKLTFTTNLATAVQQMGWGGFRKTEDKLLKKMEKLVCTNFEGKIKHFNDKY